MRVLICDDENNICHLIKEFIEWEELEMTLVGVAHSGADALQQIIEHRPEIVITDIRMPVIDGLEMIEKIRGMGLDTQFIIISGYQNFDYARSALRCGISDYLLKPINKVELNEALAKVKRLIQEKTEPQIALEELNSAKLQIHEDLLKCILSCIPHGNFNIVKQDFIAALSSNQFLFMTLKFDSELPPQESTSNIDIVIDKAITKVKKALSAEGLQYYSIKYLNNIVSLLHAPVLPQSAVEQIGNNLFLISSHCAAAFSDIRITLGIGPCMTGFNHLADAMMGAVYSVRSRVLMGVNRIIMPQLPYKSAAFRLDTSQKTNFYNLIDRCEIDSLLPFLREILGGQTCLTERPYLVFEVTRNILDEFVIYLKDRDTIGIDAEQFFKVYHTRIDYTWTEDFLIETLEICFNIYFSAVAESKQFKTTSYMYVQMAKAYIAEHYAEECSLTTVADHVHLNACYLSNIFKLETGAGFKEYILSYRITIAKQLLRETRETVQTIAEQVGYQDLKHFRKLFKNALGINPNTYRNLYQ